MNMHASLQLYELACKKNLFATELAALLEPGGWYTVYTWAVCPLTEDKECRTKNACVLHW